MKKQTKENKGITYVGATISPQAGITLVALVITIIIMLILAGVTISMLFGENGLIKRAQTATNKWNQADQEEQEGLANLENVIDNATNGGGPIQPGDTANGNQEYTDGNGDTATIPDGFTISDEDGEYTIEDGLVIIGPDESEFVWIPVPDITKMYDEANKRGILYTFNTDGTSTERTYPTTSNSGYREPDVVTSASSGSDSTIGSSCDAVLSNLQTAGSSSTTAVGFKTELQAEFNSMIASVSTYRGFYIGRYETGNLSSTTVVSKKGNTDIANQTWYTMYAKQKALYASSTAVTSSMIWGSQWDAVMRWMQTSSNPEVVTYVTDSTGKANSTVATGGTGVIQATGSSESYKVNNIYDMAGNVFEWTLEAGSTYSRVYRRWIFQR